MTSFTNMQTSQFQLSWVSWLLRARWWWPDIRPGSCRCCLIHYRYCLLEAIGRDPRFYRGVKALLLDRKWSNKQSSWYQVPTPTLEMYHFTYLLQLNFDLKEICTDRAIASLLWRQSNRVFTLSRRNYGNNSSLPTKLERAITRLKKNQECLQKKIYKNSKMSTLTSLFT